MNLTDIQPGEAATISHIDINSPMIARLIDMGMTDASPITCLFESLSGGIRAYRIGNGVFAIRKEDARFIKISEV